MKHTGLALLTAIWLAGCAGMPQTLPPGRQALQNFTVDGRFSAKTVRPDGEFAHSSGRLTLSILGTRQRLLLANPLGIGIATLESEPGEARLRASDGQEHLAPDPDSLLLAVTGQAFPAGRLAHWLTGRTTGTLIRDAFDRPAELVEQGWHIRYAYDGDDPDAVPSRLSASGPDGSEIRLRIEDWRSAP